MLCVTFCIIMAIQKNLLSTATLNVVKVGWDGLGGHRKLGGGFFLFEECQNQMSFSTALIRKYMSLYCLQNNKLIT